MLSLPAGCSRYGDQQTCCRPFRAWRVIPVSFVFCLVWTTGGNAHICVMPPSRCEPIETDKKIHLVMCIDLYDWSECSCNSEWSCFKAISNQLPVSRCFGGPCHRASLQLVVCSAALSDKQKHHAHRNAATFNSRRLYSLVMTGRSDFSAVGGTITRRTAWDCENRSGINERIAWRSAVKSRGRSQLKNRSYSCLLSDDCRHPAGSNSRDTMRLVRLSSIAAVRLHLSLYCLICCLHLCLINSNLACISWLTTSYSILTPLSGTSQFFLH